MGELPKLYTKTPINKQVEISIHKISLKGMDKEKQMAKHTKKRRKKQNKKSKKNNPNNNSIEIL